jgi:RHS repeat-associated protein
MTDLSGSIAWAADYKPFGEVNITANSQPNRIRFPGQYFDEEKGLHYNWHRYYNLSFGRYISPDPSGLRGGINYYTYAASNSANLFDPLGLYLTTNQQIIVSIASGAGAVIGGLAVGLTSWGVGTPVGAAMGSALFGAAATSLLGGDLTDVGNATITGLSAGYIGASISYFMEAISTTGIQAAARAGAMTGIIEAILLGSDPPFDTEDKESPCE